MQENINLEVLRGVLMGLQSRAIEKNQIDGVHCEKMAEFIYNLFKREEPKDTYNEEPIKKDDDYNMDIYQKGYKEGRMAGYNDYARDCREGGFYKSENMKAKLLRKLPQKTLNIYAGCTTQ